MKRTAALLAAVCLMSAGCNASAGQSGQQKYISRAQTALENGYVLEGSADSEKPDQELIQEIKETKPAAESLQYFFNGNIQTDDKEQVQNHLTSLIDAAVRHYSQNTCLISRVSTGTAGLPVKDENGIPVSFQYKPYYDEGFRIIIPETDGLASLYWDSDVLKTAADDGRTLQQSDVNLVTGETEQNSEAVSENEGFHLRQQWIGEMLSEGVYPRAFKDKWADYFDVFFPYLCCPEYFQYQLVPVLHQKTGDGSKSWELAGWDLVIKLKEPQLLSSKMYQDTAQIRRNLGYLISNESCDWIRSDINSQSVVLQFDLEGILKSSWAEIEVNMLTHNAAGQTVWSSETVSSRWDVNEWPQGSQYRDVIEQVLQGEKPKQFLETMGIEDIYSSLKK
ncbi:MAG: hypothetical protein HUJ54_13015 [Erysipelotrichaceae bacterium]|nr:hypothetical protein [Erysipelotrichaceae bacterium]